ncbi:hypothetical protein [Fodinibius sp. Rm-B-1B1-1]|uniref:hypothetical protein n=1 Tax=Fodinibius alkaliphilus TaxID=3140241 RepID=UPI00315A6B7B
MKSTKKTDLQKALNNFITELKQLAEAYPESDFDNYLIEEVAPVLKKDDQLFSTSVFSKLRIAVILSRSELENKGYPLKDAMSFMNDDAICWLLDHIYSCNNAINMLSQFKNGYKIDPEDYKYAYDGLNSDKKQLQKWLNFDLYDRIQIYRNEIKELQGGQ